MLEHVLALGNYLNGNTPRGAAYGYKLDSLLRLGDVRPSAADAKHTPSLLHFLAQFLEKSAPDLLEVGTDVSHCDAAARVALGVAAANVQQLRSGLEAIERDLHGAGKGVGLCECVCMCL